MAVARRHVVPEVLSAGMLIYVEPRMSSPVLIGRASQLSALESALARAGRGSPSAVVVGGEAGVGKSRLVTEFAGRARGAGARVLMGGCLELGAEGLPFAPFTSVLRELVHDRKLPDPRCPALAASSGYSPARPPRRPRCIPPSAGALDALAGPPGRAARRVLFVCTANSARSHLAAALWRQASGIPTGSAGTRPAAAIRQRPGRPGHLRAWLAG